MKTRKARNGGTIKVWEPGESGNPGGPKPGYVQARTVLKRLLAAKGKFLNPFTEQMEEMSMGDALHLMQIFKAASDGDTMAYREIIDRTDGKVPTKNEHSGPDGGPIQTKTLVIELPPDDGSDEGNSQP